MDRIVEAIVNDIKKNQKPLNEVDWSKVYNLAVEIFNQSIDEDFWKDEDSYRYLEEEVMKAIYGDLFFKMSNKLPWLN